MHIQKTQITAFQSVSTAAQPPRLPDVDATDIEQAMAASTAGVLWPKPFSHILNLLRHTVVLWHKVLTGTSL